MISQRSSRPRPRRGRRRRRRRRPAPSRATRARRAQLDKIALAPSLGDAAQHGYIGGARRVVRALADRVRLDRATCNHAVNAGVDLRHEAARLADEGERRHVANARASPIGMTTRSLPMAVAARLVRSRRSRARATPTHGDAAVSSVPPATSPRRSRSPTQRSVLQFRAHAAAERRRVVEPPSGGNTRLEEIEAAAIECIVRLRERPRGRAPCGSSQRSAFARRRRAAAGRGGRGDGRREGAQRWPRACLRRSAHSLATTAPSAIRACAAELPATNSSASAARRSARRRRSGSLAASAAATPWAARLAARVPRGARGARRARARRAARRTAARRARQGRVAPPRRSARRGGARLCRRSRQGVPCVAPVGIVSEERAAPIGSSLWLA